MCRNTPLRPLTEVEVQRIVKEVSACVARETGLEEDDLRAIAEARAPGMVATWTSDLGVRPGAFLYRKLKFALWTEAKRDLRRAKFHGALPAHVDVVGGLWDDAGRVAAPDVRAMAAELLGRLPERARRVLTLRFWAGADAEEIAAELGVSVGTVERDAALAMGRLRREVDETRWRPRAAGGGPTGAGR